MAVSDTNGGFVCLTANETSGGRTWDHQVIRSPSKWSEAIAQSAHGILRNRTECQYSLETWQGPRRRRTALTGNRDTGEGSNPYPEGVEGEVKGQVPQSGLSVA